jgi:putative ABC transport system substrate-binding protein
MNRRSFIGTLAGGLLAAPLAVEAQHTAKVLRVGYLGVAGPGPGVATDAFYAGLREQGYVIGRDVLVEERYTDGTPERFLTAARELVALPVDVLVSAGTAPSLAAKKATSTTPIVFYAVPDPISVGFVAGLDRPGGNMTGITAEAGSEMAGKRVQLLKEAVPQLSRVAVLHAQDEVNVPPQLEQIKHAATLLGITVHILSFRGPNELEAVFTRMREQHAQGLVVLPGALTFASRQKIADLALAHRLPSSHALHDAVQVGGLLSLGYNIVDLNRQVTIFVAKILKGAKPADLPVEQPTKFVLVINLRTAKALGLTIPPSLLQRADQVIE